MSSTHNSAPRQSSKTAATKPAQRISATKKRLPMRSYDSASTSSNDQRSNKRRSQKPAVTTDDEDTVLLNSPSKPIRHQRAVSEASWLSKSAPTASIIDRRKANNRKSMLDNNQVAWDMPQIVGERKEALNWQQQSFAAASSPSTRPPSTKSNRQSKHARDDSAVDVDSLTFDIVLPPSKPGNTLTWQQLASQNHNESDSSFGGPPSSKKSGRQSPKKRSTNLTSAPPDKPIRKTRSSNKSSAEHDSGSETSLPLVQNLNISSGSESAAVTHTGEDVFTTPRPSSSNGPKKSPAKKAKPSGLTMTKPASPLKRSQSDTAPSQDQTPPPFSFPVLGNKYAGPDFHNSPSASSLPVPSGTSPGATTPLASPLVR